MGRVFKYVLVIVIVLFLLLARLIASSIGMVDQVAVNSNDRAIEAMEAGDMVTATRQLEAAADSAVTSASKMIILTNLGYVYVSEGNTTKGLQSFREALTYTSQNSADYYLISGEIALLEKNPKEALENYKSAYNIKANDFQINNALLDLGKV